MSANKSKIITLRVEPALYSELEKQAESREESISSYLREIIYTFAFPPSKFQEMNRVFVLKSSKVSDLLKQVERRRELVKNNISQSAEYIGKLESLSVIYDNMLHRLRDDIKNGIEDVGIKLEVEG